MTYISWFSDIGLYLEDYSMYKAVTLAGGIREPCSLALVKNWKSTFFGCYCALLYNRAFKFNNYEILEVKVIW